MQDDLFGDTPASAPRDARRSRTNSPAPQGPSDAHPRETATDAAAAPRSRRGATVDPAESAEALRELAARLPSRLRLGSSSWHFPGWRGLVWAGEHSESTLSKKGLAAYGAHPLLRTVSLDRVFYRPMTASQYAALAAQTPAGFRFLVKAPSLVADAMVRGEGGRAMEPNPLFLDPVAARQEFVEPALEGLGDRLGVLVFQLSPIPLAISAANAAAHPTANGLDVATVLDRLDRMLAAQPRLEERSPGARIAVEVRNPQLLTPALVEVLRRHGATYCLGLHPKMPPIEDQLPLLRALWPGPLIARWSLNRKHGAYGYEEAKGLYEPFDAMIDPDPETRQTLARVAAATLAAGFDAYITINNKAEGSAPLSVHALAEAVMRSWEERQPPQQAG